MSKPLFVASRLPVVNYVRDLKTRKLFRVRGRIAACVRCGKQGEVAFQVGTPNHRGKVEYWVNVCATCVRQGDSD